MKTRLTDVAVRAMKPPAQGQVTIWDKSSPIGLRIANGGTKTYIVLTGPGRRRTIGHAHIISLADAREEGARILARQVLGLDKQRSSITFDTALPLFLDDNYRGKRDKTKRESKRILEKHFLPAFRGKPLSDITDQGIGERLDRLRNVPSEQLHAFTVLRTMLRWCTRPPRRYIIHSPLEGYRPPSKHRKGTRVLTDAELVKVWNACEGQFGAMIRLLILWGTRQGETARIRRTWIENGLLSIPGPFTKNGRAHSVPLLPMAQAILEEQPEYGPYFFPGRIGLYSHFSDGAWTKPKKELEKRAGVTGWQVRDLRRTFRSNMAKLRVRREICEVLLNHVTGAGRNDLDEIYDRYDYADEKREALAKLEAHLTRLFS